MDTPLDLDNLTRQTRQREFEDGLFEGAMTWSSQFASSGVLAADLEPNAIARRHNDAGRPYLNVEFNRLSGLKWPWLIMSVIGSVG